MGLAKKSKEEDHSDDAPNMKNELISKYESLEDEKFWHNYVKILPLSNDMWIRLYIYLCIYVKIWLFWHNSSKFDYFVYDYTIHIKLKWKSTNCHLQS